LMRVYLDEGLFESSTADPVCIIELIGMAGDGRHRILLSPSFRDRDERNLPRDRWIGRQEEHLRQRLAQLLVVSASEASMSALDVPRITVIDGDQSDWIAGDLCMADALRLLRAPLRLLVENRRSDWAFLLAIVDGAHRRALRDAEHKNWLDVQHGGGLGEIKDRLRNIVAPAAKDAGWHLERLRTWVMFDRDADVEDPRRPSRDSNEVLELCRSDELHGPWSFPHLQLGRRTIESYIPLEALAARDGAGDPASPKVARRKALGDLREEHPISAFAYNMKEGFMKDARTVDKRDRATLRKQWQSAASPEDRHPMVPPGEALPEAWRALPTEIVAELLFGFGKDVAEAFEQCDAEPRWEEWIRREYERGPDGQPSRLQIATQILELV
jgi:hypothetical protein